MYSMYKENLGIIKNHEKLLSLKVLVRTELGVSGHKVTIYECNE